MFPRKPYGLLSILFLSLACSVSVMADTPPQRTYIERVQSDNPLEVSVRFVKAWQRGDFYETWVLFTPDTKRQFLKNFATTYSFKGLLNLKKDESTLPGAKFWGEHEPAPSVREDYNMDYGLQFDDVMYAGSKLNVLPFRFGPGYTVALNEKSQHEATVNVDTNAQPAAVQIKLRQNMPNNNWRIEQVVWEGSDTSARPWGIRAK